MFKYPFNWKNCVVAATFYCYFWSGPKNYLPWSLILLAGVILVQLERCLNLYCGQLLLLVLIWMFHHQRGWLIHLIVLWYVLYNSTWFLCGYHCCAYLWLCYFTTCIIMKPFCKRCKWKTVSFSNFILLLRCIWLKSEVRISLTLFTSLVQIGLLFYNQFVWLMSYACVLMCVWKYLGLSLLTSTTEVKILLASMNTSLSLTK